MIKNTGDDHMELVTYAHPDTPGYRLKEPMPPPNPIPPGKEVCILCYEPGVSYSIRPIEHPDVPRSLI